MEQDATRREPPRAAAASPLVELPPADTKRWVVRRKAIVVSAVRNGLISLEDACRRYRISLEEFVAWQRAIDRHGVPGLRVTRIQIYRDAPPMSRRLSVAGAARGQPVRSG
jgi:hypothetical protein